MGMYTPTQIEYQLRFDTKRLAVKIEESVVEHTIGRQWKTFIEARDMLFIATVDSLGRPACSYKGGAVGFVRVVDESTLVFPLYDGNGLFISAGNLFDTSLVELLFVDFENPQRLRVGGRATVHEPTQEEAVTYHEAKLIVRIHVDYLYVNCKRYVHQYKRVEASPYVPEGGRPTPVAAWKLLPYVLPVLSAADRAEIERRHANGENLPDAAGQAEKPRRS